MERRQKMTLGDSNLRCSNTFGYSNTLISPCWLVPITPYFPHKDFLSTCPSPFLSPFPFLVGPDTPVMAFESSDLTSECENIDPFPYPLNPGYCFEHLYPYPVMFTRPDLEKFVSRVCRNSKVFTREFTSCE